MDKTLEEVYKELLESQEDLPEEFVKILDDNFWDLCNTKED